MVKNKSVSELYIRQDLGEGRPLVLLHGMFADGTQWRVMADMLAKDFRVIVVDLLGHGKSPRPKNSSYTPHEHSASLRKTLEKIDATKDATIVGYSMGGTVALQYAADYEDVAQLYMISTPFYLQPDDMVAAGYANSLFYTKLSVGLFRQVDKLLRPGKILHKLVKKDNLMKALHYLIDAYDNDLDPEIMRLNLDQLIINYPFASNLAKVTSPITFFSGKRDVFVVQGQLPALKKLRPFMEIETLGIVKNDHMLVQYLPQKMVGILKRYHDQELNVGADVGSGEILLLLHGTESSSLYWSNIIPILSQQYRVVALDLLGFGKSPKPLNIAYTVEDQVRWIERTLQPKGLKKFHIIGHSLGALIATAYTETYPAKVQSLTLISPVIYDESMTSKRFLLRKMKLLDYFSSTSYLASTVSRAVGPNSIKPYIPTVRSIDNAIRNQPYAAFTANISQVPTTILFGDNDPLVDSIQVSEVAKAFKKVSVVAIKDGAHNFPLSDPKNLLKNMNFKLSAVDAKRSNIKPVQIFKQLAKLAVPIMFTKGLFYLAAGLLLFSQFKEETLVIAVSTIVIIQSIQFVRGSFSLKNEGLSYISYAFIGFVGMIFGYILFNNFDLSLRLALIVVSGLILANGASRLLAGIFWTTKQPQRRRQIITGLVLILFSMAAFLGSSVSLYVIVYSFAAYFLFRGASYMFYSFVTLGLSYIRSYS